VILTYVGRWTTQLLIDENKALGEMKNDLTRGTGEVDIGA
jgi:hypothetical protein